MKYASKEELAAGLARGEQSAFEDFAQAYGPRLNAYFRSRGLSISDAESLAVSMVTDISMKAHRFHANPGAQFDAWVFTLAWHGLVDWWRQQQPFVNSSDVPLPAEPLLSPPNVDLIAAVRDALSRLSATDQEIVRRRDMESIDRYEDIGTDLHMEPGTARVRRLRALQKLEIELLADPRIQQFLKSRHREEDDGK